MKITRNSIATGKGPSGWFTGDVYIDAVAEPSESYRLAAANVHFTPGARTAWHTHPLGQTIFVTEGVGRCQREGGPVEEIRGGDRVFFEPGENHWHGAAPDRFMVHVAMHQVDEQGSSVTWGSTSATRTTASSVRNRRLSLIAPRHMCRGQSVHVRIGMRGRMRPRAGRAHARLRRLRSSLESTASASAGRRR
jgi:quercetin dioxygenase-like cupin family protein